MPSLLDRLPQTSTVRCHDGRPVGTVFEEDRINVRLSSLPRHVVSAFVSAEDKRFYHHPGVDPVAIARATIHNLRARRIVEGGSTITQQLARSAILHSRRRSVWRKLREIVLALRMERAFSKHEILEAYLSAIWFGHGVYGLHNAALVYFGLEPHLLNIEQAACLAGLVRAPGKLSPRVNPELSRRRRDNVLRRLREDGKISRHTERTAAARGLEFHAPVVAERTSRPALAQYYLDEVKCRLRAEHPKLYPRHRLAVDGTLDRSCQQALGRSVRSFNATQPGRSLAVIVTAHQTGDLLAITSGSCYSRQQFNTAFAGRLQPGSLMKPFVLAAALASGMSPETEYSSEPARIPLDGGVWDVRNYGDVYRGRISLAQALAVSDNCVFARLACDIGLQAIVAVLQSVGLAPRRPTIAVALGSADRGYSPAALGSAYSVFANEGRRIPVRSYCAVTDLSTARRYTTRLEAPVVLDAGICSEVDRVLRDVVAGGTAAGLSTHGGLRAKTGTTEQGSLVVSYDPFFEVTTWVDASAEMAQSTLPGKASTAVDLSNRIWHWLRSREFLADFWGVLRGSDSLTQRERMRLSKDFATNS